MDFSLLPDPLDAPDHAPCIAGLTRFDVALGRGGPIRANAGNVRLRNYIGLVFHHYETIACGKKHLFAEAVARKIQIRGRFVERNEDGVWRDAPHKLGVRKTQVLLREYTLKERQRRGRQLELAKRCEDDGDAAYESEQYAMAIQSYEKAIDLREQYSPGSLALARSYDKLALVLKDTARYEASVVIYRKALEIRKLKAPNSLELALNQSYLGMPLWFLERWEEAIECFEASAAVYKILGGGVGAWTPLRNIGIIMDMQGNSEAAVANLTEAFQVQEHDAEVNLSDKLDLLHDLCAAHWHNGNEAEAIACMEKVRKFEHADDDRDDSSDQSLE